MSTIAAISSSMGRSGLGIVRMSGPKALNILKSVFKEDRQFENRKMTYGHIYDGTRIIDEVLAVYMKGPHTYNGEDIVEIYTHGGVVAVREVLDLLLESGADLASPGEFTQRAFLNGKLDLVQAEAVLDIIDANTSRSHHNSVAQLEGTLSDKVRDIRQDIKTVLASSITEIDFPDDENDTLSDDEKLKDLTTVKTSLGQLIQTSKRGKILREGIKTLILGRPNVGKSSLLNVLLKENRAIVTDIPGTTRDFIEEILDLDGIPLKLIDTAGIRSTDDEVERIGVDMAKDRLQDVDLVLLVLDNTSPLTEDDKDLLELTRDHNRIIIINKTDVEGQLDKDSLEDEYIEISALEDIGIHTILDTIKDMYFSDKISVDDEVYVSNVRHIDLLNRGLRSLDQAIDALGMGIPLDLVEIDLNDAIDHLGAITGDAAGEDILDQIFSEFCIGK